MATSGTNAYSTRLGVAVQDLMNASGGRPRFVRIATRLAGEVTKGVRRGDHVVEMVVLAGVSYQSMIEKSKTALELAAQDPAFVGNMVAAMAAAGVTDEVKGAPITDADVNDALNGQVRGRKGLLTAYNETLAGANPDSTSAHVYEPLTVDGDVVDGCKVYNGPGDPSDPKAPITGAVYIAGVTIASKVITPSPNGDKLSGKQGAVAAAKSFIESALSLPAARYRTYRLLPGEKFEVVSGDVAFHTNPVGAVLRGVAP